MKLKIFDITNTKSQPKGRPYLTISAKGIFTLNKAMCDDCALKEGDVLKFAQDEKRPGDWYLITGAKKEEGFTLRSKGKAGTMLMFNCAGLAEEIFKSLNYKEKSGRIATGCEPIQHDGLTLIPLITSTLKAK